MPLVVFTPAHEPVAVHDVADMRAQVGMAITALQGRLGCPMEGQAKHVGTLLSTYESTCTTGPLVVHVLGVTIGRQPKLFKISFRHAQDVPPPRP